MVEARRPHLSEKRKAGIVETKMRMAEMPEARKEAWEEEMPACWKRRGAY
jgi:hypothetical protein